VEWNALTKVSAPDGRRNLYHSRRIRTLSHPFARLIDWYTAQCNGDWEHQHGFDISTLDNPGIHLRVDLNGTPLERAAFERIEHDIDSESRWLVCEKTAEGYFDGACAPAMSERLLEIFVNWASEQVDGSGGNRPAAR
jgi:hypothetical protein